MLATRDGTPRRPRRATDHRAPASAPQPDPSPICTSGNVLIDGDHLAVIDFDDAAFGWHLVRPRRRPHVLIRTYALTSRGFRDASLGAVATEAVRPLPDDVVQLAADVPFPIQGRLVQIGWLHARPELPESGSGLRAAQG